MELTKDNSKYCFRCHSIKPFTEYTKDKSRKSGYDNLCKQCKKAKNTKYYQNKLKQMDEHKINAHEAVQEV